MNDIRQWLTGLGLERFGDAFEREELTPANLPELTDDELRELGLPLGPRFDRLSYGAKPDPYPSSSRSRR